MSEHEHEGASSADVKTWILGALWAISMALAGFVGTGFANKLERHDDAIAMLMQQHAAMEVRVGSSGSAVDGIGPRLDDMSQKLATLTAQVQGLRSDLDKTERGERRSIGR
jgi:hypothetical protein